MVQVRFAFALTGAGWADGSLAIGEKVARPRRCSYLSDALADFARAVLALLRGADQAACNWYDEPGTLGWRFTRHGQRVHVNAIAFGETFNKRPDDEGIRNELGTCTLVELATAVRDGMQDVLETWGLEGYREKWDLYDFPLAEYEQLETLLRDIPVEG
jgi:hypothetical protein